MVHDEEDVDETGLANEEGAESGAERDTNKKHAHKHGEGPSALSRFGGVGEICVHSSTGCRHAWKKD